MREFQEREKNVFADSSPIIREQNKPPYQPPIVLPLGELAKGQGACGPGSLAIGNCSTGDEAAAGVNCKNGSVPPKHCKGGGQP